MRKGRSSSGDILFLPPLWTPFMRMIGRHALWRTCRRRGMSSLPYFVHQSETELQLFILCHDRLFFLCLFLSQCVLFNNGVKPCTGKMPSSINLMQPIGLL